MKTNEYIGLYNQRGVLVDPLVLIFVCIAASFVLSKIFDRLKIPSVIGPILVGIFLGLPFIKIYLVDSDLTLLGWLSEVGIMFLMFYLGLEFDMLSLEKHSKRPILIATLAFLFPFIFGFIGCFFLFKVGLFASIVIGFAIGLTSSAVAIVILKDNNLLSSKIGQAIVGASLLDDLFGFVILLGLITVIRTTKDPNLGFMFIIFDFLIFFALIYIVRFLVVPLVLKLIEKRDEKTDLFVVSLIMVLLMAIASTYLGVDSLIGCFIAGVVVRYTLLSGGKMEYREEKEVTELVEVATFGFLAPFFFIWLGFHFDFISIIKANYLFAIFIIVAALLGKYIGSYLGNIFGGGEAKDSIVIGNGMNIRGEVELVIADLAREGSVISVPIFSAIVLMSLVTTLLSAVLFRNSIDNYVKMNGRKKKEAAKSS